MKNPNLTTQILTVISRALTSRTIRVLTGVIVMGTAASVNAETLRLPTYYTSPLGTYDQLQLKPRAKLSGTCDIGTLYYYQGSGSEDNQIYNCIDPQKDDTGEWGPLGSATGTIWSQDMNGSIYEIYPTKNDTIDFRIGIGDNTPNETIEFEIEDTGLGQSAGIILSTAADAWQSSDFEFMRRLGSHSPGGSVAVPAGYKIGEIQGNAGYLGGYGHIASIEFKTGSELTTTSSPGRIGFLTTPDGSEARTERVRLDEKGHFGIGEKKPDGTLHMNDVDGEIIAEGTAGDAGFLFVPESGKQFAIKAIANDDKLQFLADNDIINNPGTPLMTMTAGGKLGLGTTDPETDLHIFSDDATMLIENPIANSSVGLTLRPGGNRPVDYRFYTNGDSLKLYAINRTTSYQRFLFASDKNGRLSVGRHHLPGYSLDVDQDVNLAWGGYRDHAGCLVGGCTSDARLKEDIARLSGSLDKLSALRPVTFTFKDEKYGQGQQAGLIAQEVEQVFPELIEARKDDGYKTIRYGSEIPMHLIQAAKELKTKNEQLRTKLIQMNNMFEQLQSSRQTSAVNAANTEK